MRHSSLFFRAAFGLALLILAACNLSPQSEVPTGPERVITPTLPPVVAGIVTATPNTTINSILFLGDSITEGWNVTALFPGAVNAGRRSDVTGQVLERYTTQYAGQNYDAVVIAAGLNDISAGLTDDTLRQNITTLTEQVRSSARRVFIGSLLPVGEPTLWARTRQRILDNNQWLRDYAASQGFGFLDYFTPMIDANGNAVSLYFQDGLHPTRTGYAVMAEVLAAALR